MRGSFAGKVASQSRTKPPRFPSLCLRRSGAGVRGPGNDPIISPALAVYNARILQQTCCESRCVLSSTAQCQLDTIMSGAGNTYRGTPNKRGAPPFENSPSSIPRPKLEQTQSTQHSEISGTSTLSASRQKQSKRDEVSMSNQSVA